MSIWIDCPSCQEDIEVHGEDMSELACNSFDVECHHCQVEINCNWYAEIQVNGVHNDN